MDKNKLTTREMLVQLLAGSKISCTGWYDHMFIHLGDVGLLDGRGLSVDWSSLDDVSLDDDEYWYVWDEPT